MIPVLLDHVALSRLRPRRGAALDAVALHGALEIELLRRRAGGKLRLIRIPPRGPPGPPAAAEPPAALSSAHDGRRAEGQSPRPRGPTGRRRSGRCRPPRASLVKGIRSWFAAADVRARILRRTACDAAASRARAHAHASQRDCVRALWSCNARVAPQVRNCWISNTRIGSRPPRSRVIARRC